MKVYIRFLLVMISFAKFGICNAQTIKGQVIDGNNNPIEFANVALLQPKDSAFVTGAASNKDGSFILHASTNGEYLLRVSLVGYKSVIKNVTLSSNDGKKDIISLLPEARILKGAVITAKTMEQFAEKQTFHFSSQDMDKMKNALDVLNLIPALSVLPGGKLGLKSGGTVKILINGVNATESDLAIMKQDEIARIDYYEDPPAQYAAMGLSAVVNIITKKQQHGGSVGISLQQIGVTSIFGNNTVGAKYNFNNSQVGVKYDSQIRKSDEDQKDEFLKYTFDGITYEKDKQGVSSPWDMYVHDFSLNYNNQKDNSYLFSATSGLEYQLEKSDYRQNIIRNSMSGVSGNTYNKTLYVKPWVDFYYNKIFNKNNSLTLNATGTYYDTQNKNSYSERDSVQDLFDSKSDVDGDKYSVISNAVYYMKINGISLSYGIRDYYAYAKQNVISNDNEHLSSYTNQLYLYGELFGAKGKFYYRATLGAVKNNFESTQLDKKYSFFTIQPFARLTYRPSSSSSIFGEYMLQTVNPTLSQLSVTPIMLDDKLAYCGNSDLKPYKSHTFFLGYNYYKNRISGFAYVYYQCSPRPILPYFRETGDYILESYDNLHSKKAYYSYANIDCYPFASKWLYLSLNGQFYRIESNGKGFSWGYNTFRIIPEMRMYYKKYSMFFHYQTPTKIMDGQLLRKSEQSILCEINYRPIKGMSIGLGLAKFYDSGFETIKSSMIVHNSTEKIMDERNLVYLNFNYNFSIGKTVKEITKKINEEDTDSGILKSY